MDDKTIEILKSVFHVMLEETETVLAIIQKVKDLFDALGVLLLISVGILDEFA